MVEKSRVLVTGGAGFIGSFLTDALIAKGYKVRVLDNLEEQVHSGNIPSYLNPHAEFLKGDVRDYNTIEKSLVGVDAVFHLAARVGVGQSNYEIKNYTDVNIGGMVNLLDIIVNKKTRVKKIVMTASMTSYGEGEYRCQSCGIVKPCLRFDHQMKKKDWQMYCPTCGGMIVPVPTKETATINNNSIYALSKNVQEEMMFFVGKTYNIPVVSLRCFNVYGPRQSLSNPYTGVTAIFISRLKNDQQPVIYEDGLQSRDFVSVHDVVNALVLSLESERANFEIFNIGGGKPTTIKEIAEIMAKLLGKKISPRINGEFRKNDIRHCFADIAKAKKKLSWIPKVTLAQGFEELIRWSSEIEAVDLFQKAEKELREKKLL